LKPHNAQTLCIRRIIVEPILLVESLLMTQVYNSRFHNICYEISIFFWGGGRNTHVTKKLTTCILALVFLAMEPLKSDSPIPLILLSKDSGLVNVS